MRNITSDTEPYLGNKAGYTVSAAMVAGGGSQINGMTFHYASKGDYDSWEALGNPGWGYEGLKPYMKKSTEFTAPTVEIQKSLNYSYDASGYGTDGPVQVSFPDFQYPDLYKFKDSFAEDGIPFIKEHALGNATGVFFVPSDIKPEDKTRSSSLFAYYDKVSSRTNLKLLPMHQARKILFDPKSDSSTLVATGIEAINRTSGTIVQFTAKKEVILAAGAIFTPQLLQWSGIGPNDVLEAAGIETKIDLAAVGSNFQDHPVTFLSWTLNNTFPTPTELTTNTTFWTESEALYTDKKTGPLTKAQGGLIAFPSLNMITNDSSTLLSTLQSQKSTDYLPSIYASYSELKAGVKAQRTILAKQIEEGTVAIAEIPGSGGGSQPNALQKPFSRGTIHVNPKDVYGNPLILHDTFHNPFDKTLMFKSIQYTRKLFSSKALAPLSPVEVLPGAQHTDETSVIDALLAAGVLTPSFAHPSCSCPMMPRNIGGVVDSELRVYGTSRLSIVDASVLPIIPAAHLQGTMYAVAEKAVAIIKARA
ncbi:choline dehydrogenase [Venturia nashicola]|nr:choline dehydrogenase [Venturia nashicola]